MDNEKAGALIASLRKERGLTQRKLADMLHVSDRTVSKWERGAGCPDVTLLAALSDIFSVHIESILDGTLSQNRADGGNMKRLQFYACPICGNILTATGSAQVTCCGRRLEPLAVRQADGEHTLSVTPMDDEWYITFPHPMEKTHFLRFIAYAAYDRALIVRLYPEQGGELTIPQLSGGKLYCCCSEHGLFAQP